MSKEIILVYQDCPMCGSRKDWGDKQIAAAKAEDASIRKVSFVSKDGRKYCAEALKAKKASMPFFTDGEGHFGKSVEELLGIDKVEEKNEEPTEVVEKPKNKKKKGSRKTNVDKKQDN